MTQIINSDYRDRCRSDRPDPYPVHVLKRVDRPTNIINEDDIKRKDERRGGFHRAGLGEFGERLQKEYKRFVPKHPLSGALVTMAGALGHMVDAPTFSSDKFFLVASQDADCVECFRIDPETDALELAHTQDAPCAADVAVICPLSFNL